MSFIKVGEADEMPAGMTKVVNVDGKKILVVNADGRYYALENRCSHIGKPLDKASLAGSILTCSYHGAQFDVKDGKNLKDGKLLFFNMACKNLKTYPVKVEGSEIFVDQA